MSGRAEQTTTTDKETTMSAPALAATPGHGVSMTPVQGAWPADRQVTVRMPTAAAMAAHLGLPGVPRPAGSPAPVPVRADALRGPAAANPTSVSVNRVDAAARVDVVLRDDGSGDVLVDGTPVANSINVAETYAAIVALVLDTAGKAGRPVQMSVVSTGGIRRSLVAPDGSVRELGAGAPHDGDRSTASGGTAAGAALDGASATEAPTRSAASTMPAAPPSPRRAVPLSPWPGAQPWVPAAPSMVTPSPVVPPQVVAQSQPAGQPAPSGDVQPPLVPSTGVPQPAPVALAPAPADPPAELMLPAAPTSLAEPTAPHQPAEPSDSAAGSPDLAPVTGPAHPQRGVRPPADGLPVRSCPPAPLVVLGAHGGAGESALAALAPGWYAAGHAWPAPGGARQPVVLVARTSVTGLTAARTAATQWASGQVLHVELVGLVLVADAPGRLPRPLRDLAKVVSGGVPRVWHVPWVEAWRTDPPQLSETPKEVRRTVRQLDALTQPGATGA